MIVSFYDEKFKGLQNNAALVIDNASYTLIKRGVDFDSLSCKCEPFTENIQPTFVVVKNDRGNYVYSCLAGIPQLNKDNQTEIVGADLKTMLKSDIYLSAGRTYLYVNDFLTGIFATWKDQVNKGSFTVELRFNENVGRIEFENLKPIGDEVGVYNVWEDIFVPYLRYYGLFMTSQIDILNKKVVFTIGRSMYRDKNVKLWEMGISNYGKQIASVNETQCVLYNKTAGSIELGINWILTSDNRITTNVAYRDIFPIKRKVIWKEFEDGETLEETQENQTTLLNEGNQEALEELAGNMFNENLELSGIDADFETKFNIYVQKGKGLYKALPCGELHYNAFGLTKVQIGYRFTGLQFLF